MVVIIAASAIAAVVVAEDADKDVDFPIKVCTNSVFIPFGAFKENVVSLLNVLPVLFVNTFSAVHSSIIKDVGDAVVLVTVWDDVPANVVNTPLDIEETIDDSVVVGVNMETDVVTFCTAAVCVQIALPKEVELLGFESLLKSMVVFVGVASIVDCVVEGTTAVTVIGPVVVVVVVVDVNVIVIGGGVADFVVKADTGVNTIKLFSTFSSAFSVSSFLLELSSINVIAVAGVLLIPQSENELVFTADTSVDAGFIDDG